MLLQVTLAQADALGRDFHQLVLGDEFHGLFQRQLDGRRQVDGLVLARSAHVGQLLLADRVDHQIIVTRVDADDHALVQRIVGLDEHPSPVLQLPERIGHGRPVILRDQHTLAAPLDLARPRAVFLEDVAHDAGTARHVQELVLEADQATGRHSVFQTHPALAIRLHVLQLATAATQRLHHGALVLFLQVHRQRLIGLLTLAIHHLQTRLGS